MKKIKSAHCFLILSIILLSSISVIPAYAAEPAPAGNGQSVPEEIDIGPGGTVIEEKALEQPVLKKIDVDRIGANAYYETFEGLRFAKYFTVAQRVEIYQEPRPIDAYILDAKSMSMIYGFPWNEEVNFRSQIMPMFTRAYGTEITMSDPNNKEGQIRYTHDYREIYKQYYPKYPTIKEEMWDQNEILLMHAKRIPGIGWNYTSNIGYRYSTINIKSDNGGFEIRHTYFGSLSLAPSDRLEFFQQFEYFKSMHIRSDFNFRPDHYLTRTEVRMKSADFKSSYIPSFSYSIDKFYPFRNMFSKYEIAFRYGRDFTQRLSGSSLLKYVYAFRDEPDNMAPSYATPNPFHDVAKTVSIENRISYNFYDRLYAQAGFDFASGLNMSDFDNFGTLIGLEYYAPGMIRVNVGWRYNRYYNIEDDLSSVYFRFYLFM